MQTSRLSADTIAAITRLLSIYIQQHGPQIIGAQLGLLVSEALRPQSLRALGGLKSLTQNELRHLLQPNLSTADSPDIWFHINVGGTDVEATYATSANRDEVAGLPLWKAYSNPNVREQLAVNAAGIIRSVGQGAPVPDGHKFMQRPTSDEYKDLARQFADNQTDLAVRAYLLDALQGPEFYDRWITELRRLRTPSLNLLREWETVRAEYVAKRLQESLTECGVESARAAEIAANARPIVATGRPQQTKSPVATPVKSSTQPSSNDIPEIEALRAFLHAAIDVMSASELRELRLPVGAVHDAKLRTRG